MRQSKVEVYLHFVWGTSNRLPFLTNEVERRVHRCIASEAEQTGCEVLAIGGMSDHVHLLVKMPSQLSPAKLMHQVKGITSRFIHTQLDNLEGFSWQEGYGVFSVTPSHRKAVVEYVLNQKQHHAENTTHPHWEETDEEYVPKVSPTE